MYPLGNEHSITLLYHCSACYSIFSVTTLYCFYRLVVTYFFPVALNDRAVPVVLAIHSFPVDDAVFFLLSSFYFSCHFGIASPVKNVNNRYTCQEKVSFLSLIFSSRSSAHAEMCMSTFI